MGEDPFTVHEVTSDGLLNDLPGTLSLSEENLLLVVVLAGGDYDDVSLHGRSFWD